MASSGVITGQWLIANGTAMVIEFTYAIEANGTVYFEPQFANDEGQTIDFSGYASMQLINTGATNATLTVQLYGDNSNTEANFLIPVDIYGTAHPALCTALAFTSTPKKAFENIVIPLFRRIRWAFTEASNAATITGKAYLCLSVAKGKG